MSVQSVTFKILSDEVLTKRNRLIETLTEQIRDANLSATADEHPNSAVMEGTMGVHLERIKGKVFVRCYSPLSLNPVTGKYEPRILSFDEKDFLLAVKALGIEEE